METPYSPLKNKGKDKNKMMKKFNFKELDNTINQFTLALSYLFYSTNISYL